MAEKTTKQRTDVKQALSNFYARPVALVSLELLLSIILVIVLAVFAIQPTLVIMSDLIKEIEDKQELSGQLDNKITQLGTAQTLYLQIENRLPLLDEAIPSQPQLIKSLKVIELLASESNVVIESAAVVTVPEENQPDQAANRVDLVPLPVTVTVTGDYTSIRSYVEALRQVRRSFVVDTITFTLQENRGSQSLSASITLNVPYFGVKP